MFNEGGKIPHVDPDEVFLDSSNLPSFATERFEGRIERTLSKRAIIFLGVLFALFAVVYLGRIASLQVWGGENFSVWSLDNNLQQTILFAERGAIYDRDGEVLAWNDLEGNRRYVEESGFAHLLGYTGLSDDPDSTAHPDEQVGKSGVEKLYNEHLKGINGLKVSEVNARQETVSESVQRNPERGELVQLSIDKKVQAALYESLASLIDERGFEAGSAVIMDVRNGSILALTNYPEYDPNIFSEEDNSAQLQEYFTDRKKPFLNRAVSGLYTPGSTIKPYVAIGALEEEVISPTKQILSTGELLLPNPYDPDNPTRFADWKEHGLVDVKKALAVSSNVYFYEVGGGFEDQEGIEISGIEKYTRMFGFGEATNTNLGSEPSGTIPSPRWKEENFDGEPWRIGDTYHTAIGQYGFQVTPLQMAKAVAAIANGGHLLEPTFLKGVGNGQAVYGKGDKVSVDDETLETVREGMRLGVTDGIASALNLSGVKVAAKTGTAELGVKKDFVNSWVTGFFPYEEPKYAFVIVAEKGPSTNLVGATFAMKETLEKMLEEAPEYLNKSIDQEL